VQRRAPSLDSALAPLPPKARRHPDEPKAERAPTERSLVTALHATAAAPLEARPVETAARAAVRGEAAAHARAAELPLLKLRDSLFSMGATISSRTISRLLTFGILSLFGGCSFESMDRQSIEQIRITAKNQ
jgi:hypothetical protein